MAYHEKQEQIVDIITAKTQSNNRHFFRILTTYYFAKLASMMRAEVVTLDRGAIPINVYALNLAPSGCGKGFSMNIFEEHLIKGFREKFLENVFPNVAGTNITKLAKKRAIRDGHDNQSEWQEKLEAEFEALGTLAFSFDSGTTPAVKQMRQKLLLANAGSMCLEIDEISSNFAGNAEVLTTYLELYDKGLIKQKLVKNTKENQRYEEIWGKTPTNLMLFGTPVKLLDGSKIEEDFKEMLEIGYARRFLIGYTNEVLHNTHKNASDLFDALTDSKLNTAIQQLSSYFTNLATMSNFNRLIQVDKATTLEYLQYKLDCEHSAADLPQHEDVRKAEMSHRYFKVIKVAGTYAFIDQSPAVTEEHIDNAIELTEASGEQFSHLLRKEGTYAKLARYIASVGCEITHVDLIENLPFYKGSKNDKTELIDLAAAYGYQNNIVIRRRDVNGIEFISGESLQETNPDSMNISFSKDITLNYVTQQVPFNDLHKLVCSPGFNYCAHSFKNGYRDREHVIPGFNLLILDVDHGLKMSTAKMLLEEYTALYATTKRHTKDKHRFRIILPMSHTIKLNPGEYSKFMENVFNWLPFPVDTATKDIARKWLSHKGTYEYTDGILIDATEFIPQTQKAMIQDKLMLTQESMNNVERWFARNISVGNRNTMLLRYGYILLDHGMEAVDATNVLKKFNTKIDNPLDEDEINGTILKSLIVKGNK